MNIREYLGNNGYNTISDETESYILEWQDWYQGYVKGFHQYTVFNGLETISFDRYSLAMAKRVCEDWANLLMNEKTAVTTSKEALNKQLEAIFEHNNFDIRANQLIELIFAFGTGAFVEYMDNGQIIIDYVRADMIHPLAWDNGDITECAFASSRQVGGLEVTYLQIHRKNARGLYEIENHYINADTGKDMELPEGLLPIVETGISIPLFQIMTPNIVNNIDLDSPMGISVFANAIDQLEGVDLAYDSYCNEFELGKTKIIVPLSMATIQLTADGVKKPVFNKNDTRFYAIPGGRESDNKITHISVPIRADEHNAGIQKMLDLLSFKCGLGNSRFQFDGAGVKTATEIISEQSELFQNLKKHKIILEYALRGLVKGISALLGNQSDIEVTVSFDDSIIEDKATERTQDRQDVAMGVMSLWEYRAKWYAEDEETAKRMIPEQADILPDNLQM
ncbi:phage portal protein [Parasporobacterium paucivorans]|uniref:Phage portal protein, putative, A118 family n=1 Tax=Parasporobacterium paucivorans DSM 15970 TaxID=1122934 RepID=A0A1M6B2S5_9FIRM|nr:phage portal protein [Parasporobacterium paucivorans]SHI43052.1 phage portal protein, putative, A118 family [Parasporobacterium paucivorans DSM 15970]